MKKAKQTMDFWTVEAKTNRTAADLWYFLENQERTKASGPAGKIVLTPEEVADRTHTPLHLTVDALIALVKNGWARYQNGLVTAA